MTPGTTGLKQAFPRRGYWTQDSGGAATGYRVDAGDLQQYGRVTPARGKGVLQLEAESILLPGFFPDGSGLAEFFSVGSEIDESEMDLCPTVKEPTV